MASIAEFASIPRVHCRNILPGKRRDRLASGREMLPKRYEALARLSRSLTAGAPEDWIRDLSADLRGMLPFDLLDVVVYKRTKTRSSGAHLQPSKRRERRSTRIKRYAIPSMPGSKRPS
jgi:hypothetical protein